MNRIFISHTNKDKDFLYAVEKSLSSAAANDIVIWHSDNLSIGENLGENWRLEIEHRLTHADTFVLLITEEYVNSIHATYKIGRIAQIKNYKSIPAISFVQSPVHINHTPFHDILGFPISGNMDNQFYDEIHNASLKTIETLKSSLRKRFPLDSGEVYISYRKLEPGVFSWIIESIKFLYYLIYGLQDKRYLGNPIQAIRKWAQSLISDYNFYALLFQGIILKTLITNQGFTPILFVS